MDTKGWGGWEWTHGIALTALYRVSDAYPRYEIINAKICSNVFISQHAAVEPSSAPCKHSIDTVMDWFRKQYQITDGKGVSKNINTMSPMYSLACAVEDGLVPEEEKEQWTAWLKEWAEWIMNDLPSEFCAQSVEC